MKLKLKAVHTHNGVVYPAGYVIDVDEHTAQWLIQQKIAEPVKDDTDSTSVKDDNNSTKKIKIRSN